MIEVLRNKNLTTKFQILVEIAEGGPGIQQREIAKKLEITPQAVSDYIAQLINEKMLVSKERSSYRVTNVGVNWLIKTLKELNSYNIFIQRAVNNISVCAALAEDELKKNQKVGLRMKDGLLFATSTISNEATGITTSEAKPGEDIGVSNIKGIVSLEIGKVTILKIPSIERGGSGKVNYSKLRGYIKERQIIVSLGLESFAALRKTSADFYQFGVTEAAIESAKCGLNPLVVCVENETSGLVTSLERERIRYELFDIENP